MSSAASYQALVQELYIAYFGRPADYFGVQNFEAALATAGAPTDAVGLGAVYKSNAAVTSLVDSFGKSTESTTLYAGSTTDFVNAVFQDLFNRPAAAAGLAFWTNAIDSHEVTNGQAALSILEGAMQNSSQQGLVDQQAIANKLAVSENFTAALGASSSTIVAYAGAAAAQDARLMLGQVGATTNPAGVDVQHVIDEIASNGMINTVTLTTSVGTFNGALGSIAFNAVLDNSAGLAAGGQAQTLLSGDALVGGSLNNTLNLSDFGLGGLMTIPVGVSFSGIDTVNINSLEGVSVDLSTWQGLYGINIKSSVGSDAVFADANMTVNVTDKLGNVMVQGGTAVTVATDADHVVSLSSSTAMYTVTVGDSTNIVTDVVAGASVYVTAGAGANTVTVGAGASGTVSFAAHTATDTVVLAPSQGSEKAFFVITGLNNDGADTIQFSGDSNTLAGFTQVTAAAVTGSGGDTASLAGWVHAAEGAQGSGVSGAAHSVSWFVFQGNTYLLESVAGQTADAGIMASGNTLVELTGTGYTFAHTTGAGGTVHLLG